MNKIALLDDEDLRGLIDDTLVRQHRQRALSPDHPQLRGTAQNPDVFFPGPRGDQSVTTGRVRPSCRTSWIALRSAPAGSYRLFDYVGAPDAERVIVMMGSGAGAVEETVEHLLQQGEKVGLSEGPALSGPSRPKRSSRRLPKTVQSIAVLDRTKEPGSLGEPLYLDVVTALSESRLANGTESRTSAGHRRPLRTRVEGIHPGHGEGCFR